MDKAHGKEVGISVQGLPGIIEGTDIMKYILIGDIPEDRTKYCTCSRIVCNIRSEKNDPIKVRIKVEGDLINYLGDCETPPTHLLTIKLLLNIVLSTP